MTNDYSWGVLKRRKWTAAVVGALVFFPWTVQTLRQARLSTGSSTVVIAADAKEILGPDGRVLPSNYQSFDLKLSSIRTGSVAERALDLAQGYREFESPIFRDARIQRILAGASEGYVDRADLSQDLESLQVTHLGNSQLVRICVSSHDPDRACLLAWAIAEAAHQFHDDRIRAVYRRHAEALDAESGSLESGVSLTRSRAVLAEEQWRRNEIQGAVAHAPDLPDLPDDRPAERSLGATLAIDEFRATRRAQDRHHAKTEFEARESEVGLAEGALGRFRRGSRQVRLLAESIAGPVAVAEIDQTVTRDGTGSSPVPTVFGALVVALLCALTSAFIHERADARVARDSELTEALAAPLLAAMRLRDMTADGRGPNRVEASRVESASTLAATLSLRAETSVIALVSPAEGDGRELVADCLAAALARTGKRVVSVVSDPLHRPPGDGQVERVIRSGGVQQIDRLDQEYDHVILDLAPDGDLGLSRAILQRADAVLAVARGGYTRESALRAMGLWLDSSGVTVTGTIWVYG